MLAEQVAKLVLADLNAETLEATVKDLQGQGVDVIGVPTDVANFESVKALANAAFDHFGQVDSAFLNAGIVGGGDLLSDSMAVWTNGLAVNAHDVQQRLNAFAQPALDTTPAAQDES